jgi:hypothetical protein
MRLELTDTYERGLKNFGELLSHEKAAFVIHELDLYYEMEGSFTDYVVSGAHQEELLELVRTLARIGDTESLALFEELQKHDGSNLASMDLLCTRYFQLRHIRWTKLTDYFRQCGVEVIEQ